MIIRSNKGVTARVLESIYKTLDQVIKDESCYYTRAEVEELQKRDFIKVGGK